MIYEKHRTVFVHIPKTAGSSISKALKPHRDLKTVLVRRANKTLTSMKLSYQVKSVNEVTHLSALDYAAALGRKYEDYFSFSVVRNPFDWILSFYNYFVLRNPEISMGFEDFLERKAPKAQSEYILDENGKCMVSYVGKFETINEDFKFISRKMNLSLKLPHTNSVNHLGFTTCHNVKTRRLVLEKYQRDFNLFNYSTELEV